MCCKPGCKLPIQNINTFAIADRVLRHQSIRGILPIGPKGKEM
jgi:hypothetical protein